MSFHSISSLSPGDQLLFNRFGKGPAVPLAHQTITDAFEATVSSYPYAAAVRECFGSARTVTYAELDWRSNIIANHLIDDYGVGPGQRVVCVYSRCIEMCAFIFGVLKAGAQYIPIDGAVMIEENLRQYVLTPDGGMIWPSPPVTSLGYFADREDSVIRDSGASVVLCLSHFRSKVEKSMPEEGSIDIVAIDAVNPYLWRHGDTRKPTVEIHPDDGAYVIYTYVDPTYLNGFCIWY